MNECPRCGRIVDLDKDGLIQPHAIDIELGAPPCPVAWRNMADARTAVTLAQMGKEILDASGLGCPRNCRWHRCEMHPKLARAFFDHFVLGGSGRPVDYSASATDSLFGMPLVLNPEVPDGAWRVVGDDGNTCSEGTVTL